MLVTRGRGHALTVQVEGLRYLSIWGSKMMMVSGVDLLGWGGSGCGCSGN